MNISLTKVRGILFFGLLVFFVSLYFGMQYFLASILKDETYVAGEDWARHIEYSIPKLTGMANTDGSLNAEKVPVGQEFEDLVKGVLSIGNIYQVDFINTDCFCDISIGTYDEVNLKKGGSSIANNASGKIQPHAHSTKKIKADKEAIAGKHMNHVFLNNVPHGEMGIAMNENGHMRYPVDQKIVQSIEISKMSKTIVRERHTIHEPSTFGEVYHPIIVDGHVAYVLRVLVDLEEKASRYSNYLFYGSSLILVLITATFGYPVSKYFEVSEKQVEMAQHSHYLANHDVLTDIANRHAFQTQVPDMLETCSKDNGSILLFLVDINNFKDINDYYGHHAGDLILCELANKLTQMAGPRSIVARLGGDEFAVVMCGNEHKANAGSDILGINGNFDLQVEYAGRNVRTSYSAGLVRYPRDGNDLNSLLQNADLALYKAKNSSKREIQEYRAEFGVSFKRRQDLYKEFHNALINSQIVPHYQPLVNMKTGKVEGLEALARWQHPERGIVTATAFYEVLEDKYISELLGSVMLRKILHDMRLWSEMNVDFQSVGLNVGESDLLRPSFVQDIINGVKSLNLPGSSLAIEVTENCVFGDKKELMLMKLGQLRAAGCHIALDDFGTGYSSITQIKELPCTEVKVDKTFVDNVANENVDQAIIKALLSLGNSIGYKLIIEGVETVEQMQILRSFGCELAQGYLFSAPVSAEEIPDLIQRLNPSIENNYKNTNMHAENVFGFNATG